MNTTNGTPVSERVGQVLFAVFALVLAYVKIRMVGTHPHIGWDGGLYFDVAQNIKNGDGLTINNSIYHHGFKYFPHPTTLYPLWPALLALALFVLPTQAAATWFPTALYFLSLVLAFMWGKRVLPKGRLPLGWHGGHAIVAIMGLHFDFMRTCGIPNTEALAFVLVFASLLRSPALFERMRVRDGIELGLWCGALFLTRSQAVTSLLAVIAAAPVLLLVRPQRLRTLAFVGTALVTFAITFAPMWWWMTTFVEKPSLYAYFEIAQARTASGLSSQNFIAEHPTLLARLQGILHGFELAFLTKKQGYYDLFSVFAVFVPVAAVVGVGWLVVRRKAGVLNAWSALCDPKNHGHIWGFFCALGGFALIHVAQRPGDKWWFTNRHAMPSGLFFFFCFAAIVVAGRTRWLAWLMLIAGMVHLSYKDVVDVRAKPMQPPFAAYNANLVKWLESARDKNGGHLSVALTAPEARLMGWRVPGVGYHSLSGKTGLKDLQVMCRDLNVRYLIFKRSAGRYENDARFKKMFKEVTRLKRGSGKNTFVIYGCPGVSA